MNKKKENIGFESESSLESLSNFVPGNSSSNRKIDLWNGRIRTLEQRKQKGILNKPENKEIAINEDPTKKSIRLTNNLKKRMISNGSSNNLNVID